MASHLKVSHTHIIKRLTTIPNFKTAVLSKIGLNKAIIIDDSYNSNIEGFKALLSHVQIIPVKTKILITPGIIELGKESKKIHSQLFNLAEKIFDQIIVTKKDLSHLTSSKTKLETNHKKLLSKLKQKLDSNTLVLIEGRLSLKVTKQLCQNQS